MTKRYVKVEVHHSIDFEHGALVVTILIGHKVFATTTYNLDQIISASAADAAVVDFPRDEGTRGTAYPLGS